LRNLREVPQPANAPQTPAGHGPSDRHFTHKSRGDPDFLGFHHRYVRGNTRRSRHLTFLVRWPSRQAMGHARQRIREITARSRLRVPVEVIVRDLNRFLRGWAGYFRHGNSARFFDKITLHALRRLAGFIAQRHKRRKRYGWWVVAHQTHRMGLINLNGTIIAPRPTRSRPQES
jgi:hypothetical protein